MSKVNMGLSWLIMNRILGMIQFIPSSWAQALCAGDANSKRRRKPTNCFPIPLFHLLVRPAGCGAMGFYHWSKLERICGREYEH
jgi:hypothetical protein